MQTDLFGNVPQIVVDIHETGGKGVNSVKHLMKMLEKEGIQFVVQQIPIGDVLGPDGVAVERKTVNDLVNTLKGSAAGVPRLTKQLDALLQYEKPYVLLENILAIRRDPMKGCIYIPFSSKKTKSKPFLVTMERVSFIHPSSLDALIDSIKERGIEVLEGFNALHSAGLLYGVLTDDGAIKKKTGQRLPVIRTRKGLDTLNDEQEFFIAGVPGVNVVRAKSLLEKFKTPMDTITRIDEWNDVPGIGPKTVAGAKKLLYSDYVVEESSNDDEDLDIE
ncbi:MAG: ERCC4 domain-containing protein [Candidatus Thorarchaeota archaeon]|nr:ERCC4 domain-containing protein [Candidatus Thorarchaeota archaeon]